MKPGSEIRLVRKKNMLVLYSKKEIYEENMDEIAQVLLEACLDYWAVISHSKGAMGIKCILILCLSRRQKQILEGAVDREGH